jgi:hypothetical protein
VENLRKQLEDIKVRGKNCPKPVKAFTQCGLSDKILAVMKKVRIHFVLVPIHICPQAHTNR